MLLSNMSLLKFLRRKNLEMIYREIKEWQKGDKGSVTSGLFKRNVLWLRRLALASHANFASSSYVIKVGQIAATLMTKRQREALLRSLLKLKRRHMRLLGSFSQEKHLSSRRDFWSHCCQGESAEMLTRWLEEIVFFLMVFLPCLYVV